MKTCFNLSSIQLITFQGLSDIISIGIPYIPVGIYIYVRVYTLGRFYKLPIYVTMIKEN